MKRTFSVVTLVAIVSGTAAADPAVPLLQGCGKPEEIYQRLTGYTKESSTTLDIGIIKEKWANSDGRVDVTVMPDGTVCVWREMPPRSPRRSVPDQ